MEKAKITLALTASALAVAYHVHSLQFVETMKELLEKAFG